MRAISQAFRCFDEVARRGSVRKAATSLHLTAAAVDRQVLNLEAVVGAPLFDRLPRGMQLTTAGEIVIAAVRRGQRDFDNALAQVEDLRSLRRGHVNMGVSESSAEQIIPRVIDTVMKSHPGIIFTVRTGNGENLLRWVANGEIDVAYCLRRTPPPGVEEVRAWPQWLGAVTSPGHPLAQRRKPVRVRDCLAFPLAMLAAGTELRSLVEGIDPRVHRQERPLAETGSVPLIRALAASGRAIGFLIPENVATEVAQGKVAWIPLQDPGAKSHTCLYQRNGYATAVAMGLFLAVLETEVKNVQQRVTLAVGSPKIKGRREAATRL